MKPHPVPIIAIDGTTASGKGTISYRLAKHFGFHYLNSGALYRLTAYTAITRGISLSHKEAVLEVAKTLTPLFDGKKVIVDGEDVWPIISSESYGSHASAISPDPELRNALFNTQRSMIRFPGLVADGRDMGNHVFKDACIKIYLDADITTRAKRRHQDELRKKTGKTLEYLIEEIRERDHRDMTRKEGRLYPADDAYIIDTSTMTIDEVFEECLRLCKEKGIHLEEINTSFHATHSLVRA